MYSPLYDIMNSPAMKNAQAVMDKAVIWDALNAQRDDFMTVMESVQTTALRLKMLHSPKPILLKRHICERYEAKDARIAELEQEIAEYIDMIPVIEEPSG